MAAPAFAAPQFDISVRLEPADGVLSAQAQIVLPANEPVALRLDARHRIESMQLDGAQLRLQTEHGRTRIDLAPAGRERRLDLRWAIRADPPDAAASHRDTLTAFAPQIGVAGSFLPAGGAWYPLPFDGTGAQAAPLLHRFRLDIDLPATQRALAPGDRISDTVRDGRRRVRFDMRQDSEGADLMAGPWEQSTRSVRSRDGRTLTLATLFHPDIADQAEGYLDAAASHLARFEALLGDYPYSRFTIASSPTPTGFGMAGMTYLGIEVLRLPFIRHTSLPHEILHNWWGNGVYLASEGGNWSEGLTTFMADYAMREAQGEDAARAMRLDWLRGLSALSPQAQDSLANFGGRTHDASQAIGYHKAALVFLMLRDTLGAAVFDDALRAFWLEHRHRRAGWRDLRAAFEAASGRDLGRFFAQWVDAGGLAQPRIASATYGRDGVALLLQQSPPAYDLDLPLHIRSGGATRVERLRLSDAQRTLTLPADGACIDLALDADFRLARRLAPGEAPPVLREATLDEGLGLTVLHGDDAALAAAAHSLVGGWLERAPAVVDAKLPPGGSARMVIGSLPAIDRWLVQHGLPAREKDGDVVAWAVRAPGGGTLALVAARDADALGRASRALPHYGQQGWVSFGAGRATARGQWPAATAWKTVCRR